MLKKRNVPLVAIALAAVLGASVGACRCEGAVPIYPYLTANGLYGFVDENLNMVIAPVYRSATPFTETGYAVVESEQMGYGVVDKTGNLVVPLRYKWVSLRVIGSRTLVSTERDYTNRLRFWDWRFLPGFSMMGSSSDNRLFDTKVKRTQVTIGMLENGQVLYSERIPAARSVIHRVGVEPLDETHFLIKDRLFKIADRKVKLLADNIFDRTDGPHLLQQRGTHYRLIDVEGKAISHKRYKWADSLHTALDGRSLSIPVTGDPYGEECHARVLVDDDGLQYLFPDLTKAFPLHIDAVAVHGVAADTVLVHARLIRGMSGMDRFILRWFNREASSFEYPMVDAAGRWHRDPPPENTFTASTPAGNILWPPAAHVIPDSTVDAGWRVLAYSRVSDHLYAVTVGKESIERMGLWDEQAGCWRWKPQHLYIRCLDFDRGYWTFKPDANSGYGLYHLPTGKVVIPPRYHDMSSDGMVSYQDGKRGYVRFYVDWHTQREYWEKR